MSNLPPIDEEELRVFNPQAYQDYQSSKRTGLGIIVVTIVLSIMIGLGGGNPIIVLVIGGILASLIQFSMRGFAQDARENHYRQQMETLELQRENKVMVSKIEAQRAGDTIIAQQGSTIINRSTLINSMNKFEQSDPGLAEALKIIGGFIEKSGNKEAAEIFNEFNKRIQVGEGKIVVSSLWDKLVGILPSVLSLTDVVSKVIAFIGALA